MALAILRFRGVEGDRALFHLEAGANRWFSFAVGGGEADREHGFAVLRDPVFTSPLAPLPPDGLGRGTVEVPLAHLGRGARHVQVATYRSPRRDGPALSEIVAVPVLRPLPDEPLPALTFGMGTPMHATPSRALAVPYAPRRERPLSSAMFLQHLATLLPTLLPVVSQVVGGLMGGARPAVGAVGGGGGGTATAAPPLITPQTAQLLQQLLQQILGAAGGAGAAAPAVAAPATTKSLARGLSYPSARGLSYPQPKPARPVHPARSEAFVAPALLAALPALMPLLQQVLSPETIKNVLQTVDPNRLLATITSGLVDLGKLGAQIQQQEMQHLERLNPGVNNDAATLLLASMGMSAPREAPYRRVESVALDFAGVRRVMLGGRERVVYRKGADLAFPLDLRTPKPIRDATLRLTVKHARTLDVQAERSFQVSYADSGPLLVIPSLADGQTAGLRAGEEYLVCATLTWKNKAGRAVGTSRQHLVTLAGEYLFDGVGEGGEAFALNDVAKHRDFWHRVWRGTFTGELRRRVWEARYHYSFDGAAHANGRMETVVREDTDEGRERTGRLKTGMSLSPYVLNALLPQLADSAQPLSEAELEALRAPEFAERFAQSGRTQLQFRGREGEEAACWVFPEVRLQEVTLRRIAGTDGNGQALELVEHPVRFPIPSHVHFVGTRSRP
ncbi:MAG TPA: hypothetical protein VEQ60_30510 [Longimicrobium sp.]|nr:hypothetical protein [Longimicrobium sp.]